MDINLQVVDVGDDGKAHWFKIAALTPGGEVVDRDIFRFPRQTKFDYDILTDIAARHFLRRQGLIAHGESWMPMGWKKQQGPDLVLLAASMLGARLLVDAPDINGILRKIEAGLGTVTIISTDFDGEWTGVSGNTCDDTATTIEVGINSGGKDTRGYIRFPLAALPGGLVVTSLDLKVNVTAVVSSPLADIQAYNQDGQADPNSDNCATKGVRCADDSSPYSNNITTFQSTGVKTITLPSAAEDDLEAARAAVVRYALGINEDSTVGGGESVATLESLENAGNDEPKLVVTHEPGGAMGAAI